MRTENIVRIPINIRQEKSGQLSNNIVRYEYDEMSVTLQNILSVIGKVEQTSKNEIAKQLIMKGEFKPDPARN